MISFPIPYPPTKKGKSAFCRQYGLNAYYSGKHYQQRKRDADSLHTMTIAAMKKAKIRKEIIREPVSVRFLWDDGLDVDNHAVIGKAVVDAMKGYLLVDDNKRYFRAVHHEIWDGGSILVQITPYGVHPHE